MATRTEIIDAFAGLGAGLVLMYFTHDGERVVDKACEGNGWFDPWDIYRAGGALADTILDRGRLEEWASRYKWAGKPRRVTVVMAGNIPFAGLFDMLCVLVSGHKCLVKYSSKDRVLMEFVCGILKKKLPGIHLQEYDGKGTDAVIASGSDNAIRHLRSSFGDIPAVYRGNRSSVAILDGNETPEDLKELATDIFAYSGLGCRNVSHMLLPEGYDLSRLASLAEGRTLNTKYLNGYRQRRAVLSVSGEAFTDHGAWILRQDDGFPAVLSEVTYSYYRSAQDAAEWAAGRSEELQCIVADGKWDSVLPFAATPFGKTQSPALDDYPDRVDVMEFLEKLR